jgi:transposase
MKKLFVLILAVLMASCGHQSWSKRGYKKGWIKDSVVKIDTVIQSDTIRDSVEVERVLLKYDTLLFNLCDSLGRTDTVKVKIYREKIRKEFIYLQGHIDTLKYYNDDVNVVVWKTKGKWYVHASCVKQNIQYITKEDKIKWYVYFLLGMVAMALLGFFGKKLLD